MINLFISLSILEINIYKLVVITLTQSFGTIEENRPGKVAYVQGFHAI